MTFLCSLAQNRFSFISRRDGPATLASVAAVLVPDRNARRPAMQRPYGSPARREKLRI